MKKIILTTWILLMLSLPPVFAQGAYDYGNSSSGGGGADTDLDGYLNGMSIERQDLTVVVSGSSVYLDVEAIGGGDISYWIGDVKYTLDCTTGSGASGKARVELTQGTATVPVRNVVYVSYDEQTSKLTLSAAIGPPTDAFAPVCVLVLQDAAHVDTHGPLLMQRTTETISHGDKGAISWMREKLRAIGAVYFGGIDQNFSITTSATTEDSLGFNTTTGTVFQLHRQDWKAYDIATDSIYVVNVSGNGTLTAYQAISDLNAIHEIEDGTALNDGDSINLVIWGSMNYGDESKMFVNLPSGKYTNDNDAKYDNDGTAVTTIPTTFATTGFLIAKIVVKYNTANNGTWTNLLTDAVDVWSSETANVTSPNYPSNYPNNADTTVILTKSGASKLRVHFDAFNTEANYDFVRIYNGVDVLQYTYHGNLAAFTSGAVADDTLKVRFTSDGSIKRKGFSIDALEYATAGVSGAEIVDLRGIPAGFNLNASSGGGGTAGGSDTQVQFNDGGVLGGDGGMIYTKADSMLTVYQQEYLKTPAPDHTANGDVADWQVDANTVGMFAALHLDTDGNFIEADADTIITMPCIALALETGTGVKKVLLKGFARDDSWSWTVGDFVYVSTTVGTLTQTKPSGSGDQIQIIGIATHADRLYFCPDLTIVEAP